MRPLIALTALALAALPARAAAQDAACAPGTEGFVTHDARERDELAAAVADATRGSTIQRIVDITVPGDKPQLSNQRAVSRAMQRNFPGNTQTLAAEINVMLLVHVDAQGAVTDVSIQRAAPDREFNTAAVAVVKTMRFRPAKFGGCEVPVWMLLPIRFTAPR